MSNSFKWGLRIVDLFALFLLVHLVFFSFGAPPLWAPFEPGSVRGFLLLILHPIAFIAPFFLRSIRDLPP